LQLIESSLISLLNNSYTVFKNDLENAGYLVIEEEIDKSLSPPDIKQIVKDCYSNYSNGLSKLKYVTLIGNFN